MSVSAKLLCEVSVVLEKCLGQHPWKESRESSKMIENLAHKHLPRCQAFAISHQTISDSRVCCLHRREIIGSSQSNAEEEKIGIGVFKAPKFSLVRYLWFFPMKMKAPSFIIEDMFFCFRTCEPLNMPTFVRHIQYWQHQSHPLATLPPSLNLWRSYPWFSKQLMPLLVETWHPTHFTTVGWRNLMTWQSYQQNRSVLIFSRLFI